MGEKFNGRFPHYHHPTNQPTYDEGASLPHVETQDIPTEILPKFFVKTFSQWLLDGFSGKGWKVNNQQDMILSKKAWLIANYTRSKQKRIANQRMIEALALQNEKPDILNEYLLEKAEKEALRLDYPNYKHLN